jgi:hypothetical protein
VLYQRLVGLASVTVLLTACGGASSSTPSGGTATLSVAMVDASLSMSAATVTDIQLGVDKVELLGSGQPIIIADYGSTPDLVHILDYTVQSNPLTFPTATFPAGQYTQFRLVLDSATTMISYIDGTGSHTVPLAIPSATTGGFNNANSTDSGDGQGTSGVKVNVSFTAVNGGIYGFILDFNMLHSIIFSSGNPKMKPVIVAAAQNLAGSIAGVVKNGAGIAVQNAEVDAVQSGSTINSGVSDANGNFTINVLLAGNYTLVVINSYTTLGGMSITATNYDASSGASLSVPGTFTVTAGQATNAGLITD